ncbi:MAG: 16S rRNA processing protein RimM [Acidobacteria bacterium OLB17]|nr:MAG: 16S rRNA processing protein RimM [Acidobacteria bacterium OLB17]MCZ2390912.1 ribosome maturation factor RimM [Acidobacteriota bacterium]
MAGSDELVAIARIARPRGLKGEVIADLSTDFPERFDGLEDVTLVLETGETRAAKIEDHWPQNERIVLKFAGVDSANDAEQLRNAEVCVAESEAVELEADDFYDWQLAGCRVETIHGETLGEVTEVMRTGGCEILVVTGNGRDYLIPFAASICVEVLPESRYIRVDPPEGLLEF